jgi:hypothetical protein
MSQAGALVNESGGGPFIETLTGNNSSVHVGPDGSGNINVVGDGSSIVITGNAGTHTLIASVINGGFTWIETSTNYAAAAQQGIFCNASLTVTLPPTAGISIGATILVYVDTATAVTIQANTGQMIQVGNEISASAGTTVTSVQGSILWLVFKPSDSTWHTFSSMGTWLTT